MQQTGKHDSKFAHKYGFRFSGMARTILSLQVMAEPRNKIRKLKAKRQRYGCESQRGDREKEIFFTHKGFVGGGPTRIQWFTHEAILDTLAHKGFVGGGETPRGTLHRAIPDTLAHLLLRLRHRRCGRHSQRFTHGAIPDTLAA